MQVRTSRLGAVIAAALCAALIVPTVVMATPDSDNTFAASTPVQPSVAGSVSYLDDPYDVFYVDMTQGQKFSAKLTAATPRVSLRELRRPVPDELGSGPTAALLTGCVMNVAYRPVHRATMRLLAEAGFRATTPAPGGCCGALAAHYGQPEAAQRMARQRIPEFEGADVIVVNSAGCSAHMKAYGALLADDPAWAERARSASGCGTCSRSNFVRRVVPWAA